MSLEDDHCTVIGCGKQAAVMEGGKVYCPQHALDRLLAAEAAKKNGKAVLPLRASA
jgi:hypothetical protein